MTCITQTLNIGEMIANESCGFMEITLKDVNYIGDQIYTAINGSFFERDDHFLFAVDTPVSYHDEGCKETWTVTFIGSPGTGIATIKLCVVADEDEPPAVPCGDHTTEADCTAAGCYWYDGACHGTAEVPDGDADIIDIPGQPWEAPVQSLTLHVEEIGGLPNIVNARDNETIRIVVIGDSKLVDEIVDISWQKAAAPLGDVIAIGLPLAYSVVDSVVDGVTKAKAEFDWTPGAVNIGTGVFHATMQPTDRWTQGGSSNELGFEVLASDCAVRMRVEDQDGNAVGGIDVNVGGVHHIMPADGSAAFLTLKCGEEYSALALGNADYRCVPSSQCSTVFTATEGLTVVLNITKTAAKGEIVSMSWEACHVYGGCGSTIAYWGSDVTLTISTKNIGNADGEFKTRVIDKATDAVMAETGFIPIGEGASAEHSPVFVMPEVATLSLRVELIRNA